MFKRLGMLKELASKVGRENATDLMDMVGSKEPFLVEVKIVRKGTQKKKEVIELNENQRVVLEYVEG